MSGSLFSKLKRDQRVYLGNILSCIIFVILPIVFSHANTAIAQDSSDNIEKIPGEIFTDNRWQLGLGFGFDIGRVNPEQIELNYGFDLSRQFGDKFFIEMEVAFGNISAKPFPMPPVPIGPIREVSQGKTTQGTLGIGYITNINSYDNPLILSAALSVGKQFSGEGTIDSERLDRLAQQKEISQIYKAKVSIGRRLGFSKNTWIFFQGSYYLIECDMIRYTAASGQRFRHPVSSNGRGIQAVVSVKKRFGSK